MHILHDMRVREGGGERVGGWGRGWGEWVGERVGERVGGGGGWERGWGGGRGNIKDEILTHQSTLPQPVQFP